MYVPYSHIVEYIRNVVNELSAGATNYIRGKVLSMTSGKIQFSGDASSSAILLDNEGTTIVPIVVDPTSHTHTAGQIEGGVDPEPNSAVVRTNRGDIVASGTDIQNTGFKLANDEDLSSIFIAKGQSNLDIQTTTINSGNAISDVTLSRSGNVITLTKTFGSVCNCETTTYCDCCD